MNLLIGKIISLKIALLTDHSIGINQRNKIAILSALLIEEKQDSVFLSYLTESIWQY